VVLVNGWYILGEEVKAFENNFAVIVERTIALGREWLRCLNLIF
jgi:dTDP-4-amino-4,6-dideoxygalactose transaminase